MCPCRVAHDRDRAVARGMVGGTADGTGDIVDRRREACDAIGEGVRGVDGEETGLREEPCQVAHELGDPPTQPPPWSKDDSRERSLPLWHPDLEIDRGEACGGRGARRGMVSRESGRGRGDRCGPRRLRT